MQLLSPTVRPVAKNLLNPEERVLLDSLVDSLVKYNISFLDPEGLSVVEQGTRPMPLEPAIDMLVLYGPESPLAALVHARLKSTAGPVKFDSSEAMGSLLPDGLVRVSRSLLYSQNRCYTLGFFSDQCEIEEHLQKVLVPKDHRFVCRCRTRVSSRHSASSLRTRSQWSAFVDCRRIPTSRTSLSRVSRPRRRRKVREYDSRWLKYMAKSMITFGQR